METFPKEVLTSRYQRGARIGQMLVKFKDVAGSLADVNRIASESGVDIRQSNAFAALDKSYALYNTFVEFKDPKVSHLELARRLKQSPFVLDASVVEGREGEIIDVLEFPVNWSGQRIVLVDQLSMSSMLQRVQKLFGSGGDLILYEEGLTFGEGLIGSVSEAVGKEFMARNYDYVLNLLAATGWARPKLLEAANDNRDIVIRLERCFECEGKTSESPKSNFMRGFVSGVFASITGRAMDCVEVECIARGNPYCKFKLHAAK